MKESLEVTLKFDRFRDDAGNPSCVWQWDDHEVCPFYLDEDPRRCTYLGKDLYMAENHRILPDPECPIWRGQ